jgi:hypothetical protein
MKEAFLGMSPRLRDGVVCVVLLAFGLLLVLPNFWEGIQWNPDALFYQAQIHELQGENRHDALDHVFASNLANREKARESHSPPSLQRIDNSHWVNYSSRFYRRRWTVPLLANALSPLAGTRSLEIISLLGLALIAPLAYLLLRARFSPAISAVSAVFCELLPPLLALAPHPNTDTWGLALLIATMIIAMRVYKHGMRWLPLWILAILLLSFTRDETIVVLTAVAWLALRKRSRVMLITLLSGIVASLPAPLLFAAPLKEQLAYVLHDYRIPVHPTWSSIISEYPSAFGSLVKLDFRYPVETSVPVVTFAMGLVVLAGLVMLLISRRGGDSLGTLARGSLFGAVLTLVVSVNYTAMRLELVFVPAVAVGVALLAESILARVAERSPAAVHAAAPG